jgi:ribosomal RNA-processing protein 8
MEMVELRTKWEAFMLKHEKYFDIDISDEIKKIHEKQRKSDYKKIGKKIFSQKSYETHKQLIEDPSDWHKYHDNRDVSFESYAKQDVLPINIIIHELEKKGNYTIKIIDMGCGRNKIFQHFKKNKKINITGYDHVSCNGSKVVDISELPDEDESINISIMCQALMGSNHMEYIDEATRVLTYGGELCLMAKI